VELVHKLFLADGPWGYRNAFAVAVVIGIALFGKLFIFGADYFPARVLAELLWLPSATGSF